MKKNVAVALGVLALLAAGAAYWNSRSDTARSQGARAPKNTPVPVLVAPVVVKDVPVRVELAGRAEAYASVAIKSRLDGQVDRLGFTIGQPVKRGQVLVQLDPRQAQAQVQQAEANLARDLAQLDRARLDVRRNQELSAKGFISPQKLDEVRSIASAMEATVKADRAALELMRLQLSHTTIRAPMDGVAGNTQVFPGSLVKVNDTVLVTLNQTSPIYVTFSVPEKRLDDIRRALRQQALPVLVRLPDDAGAPLPGEARFLDNNVDTGTGTILMKATLPNADHRLTPGQFVQVVMQLHTLSGVTVVPAEALQNGPQGPFVFVVRPEGPPLDKADAASKAGKPEKSAQADAADPAGKTDAKAAKPGEAVKPGVVVRPVQVAHISQGEAVIAQGLQPGEQVVVDGQSRLTPKSLLDIRAPALKPTATPTPTPNVAVAASAPAATLLPRP